jgi:NADP-dependent 3-hydroxy acid dehydrogenase YdfG
MATVTSTYRRKSYAAIDPTSPANSHSGRTVLITGSTSGIGLATAGAFIKASAATVIILGRREAVLSDALEKLETSRPKGSVTKILGHVCDITKQDDVDRLWKELKQDGVEVDILILNAALATQVGVLLEGTEVTWKLFETNVLANLRMSERFLAQGPHNGKV